MYAVPSLFLELMTRMNESPMGKIKLKEIEHNYENFANDGSFPIKNKINACYKQFSHHKSYRSNCIDYIKQRNEYINFIKSKA